VHDRIYGHGTHGAAMIVNLRSTHRVENAAAGEPDPLPAPRGGARPPARRRVLFRGSAEPVDCPVLQRWDLAPGDALAGPAILEQADTTLVLEPGWRAEAQGAGSLILTRSA
jgi:N-methylhydantoinase A/oxoprolinase/acetone carboxylase beta subunit